MKVRISPLRSSDLDLDTFAPDAGSRWEVWGDIAVGPLSDSGEEIFSVELVSRAEFEARLTRSRATGRVFVFERWDLAEIQAEIERCVHAAAEASDSWEAFGHGLNESMTWEFEHFERKPFRRRFWFW